jgi:CheY-like chemotaxis protein
LLDGLLDLSRLEAGSVQPAIQVLSLDRVLRNTQDLLEPIAAARALALRVRLNGLWGESDQVLLQRMVLNLGQNALRYTQKGSVLIACRPCDGGRSVRIEVWDSGIGIAPEHHEEIFKEFYQVGNTARDRRQGLGLGLSIVRRSADLLGHRIELKSLPGRGARFSITLPRADEPDVAPVVVPLVAVEQDIAGMHVLVVEDDPMAMRAVVSLLESWGCDVSSASSADEAFQLVSEGALPDVVLSDYRLEGNLNGLQTIEMLRARSSLPLAACLMSGDTDAELMQSASLHGLTLLHKPVRPAKLRSLLRSLKV